MCFNSKSFFFFFFFFIPQYNRLEDWSSLNAENINATRTVQQIKANLREIEKVRHQVCDEDLNTFDNKINDMREGAIQSVLDFTTMGRTDATGTCKCFGPPRGASHSGSVGCTSDW